MRMPWWLNRRTISAECRKYGYFQTLEWIAFMAISPITLRNWLQLDTTHSLLNAFKSQSILDSRNNSLSVHIVKRRKETITESIKQWFPHLIWQRYLLGKAFVMSQWLTSDSHSDIQFKRRRSNTRPLLSWSRPPLDRTGCDRKGWNGHKHAIIYRPTGYLLNSEQAAEVVDNSRNGT